MPAEIIIHDGNYLDFCPGGVLAGGAHGCIPRTTPKGYYAFAPHAFPIPLIPRSEWAGRIKEMEAKKSRLSDIRMTGNAGTPIPSRDQNGVGYCWCHSGVSCHLVLRALNGEPYADLSPFAIGCQIKGYRDEGGNGIEGLDWQVKNGVPTSQFWPQRSMSRSNDTPAMRANSALHKVTVSWADLDSRNFDQLATCLLNRIPVIVDYDWWSHSVCALDLVSETSIRIWNSWGDSWSDQGMGILEGSRAIPDDQCAPVGVMASAT